MGNLCPLQPYLVYTYIPNYCQPIHINTLLFSEHIVTGIAISIMHYHSFHTIVQSAYLFCEEAPFLSVSPVMDCSEKDQNRIQD